jgi:hypothetical protein
MTFKYNDISPDAIKGMALSYVNTEDITIGVGRCMDSTNSRVIRNGGTVTVVIDGGTGLNKLDAGVEATSTWYAVHVIAGPGQTTAGLLSTSATSPTLPGGYTVFRRVGWVYNDASDDLLPFVQVGNTNLRKIYWAGSGSDTLVLNNATNTGSYATVSVAIGVAPTAFEYLIRFSAQAGGDNATAIKITDIVDTGVWTRVRQNRSEYQMTTLPCPTTREFQYNSAHSSSECQAIIKGYSEVI